VDDWCYEVPADGLSEGLSPLEVAQRAPFEQVGGQAASLRHIGQFYTSNGISNEVAYVYLATGVERGRPNASPQS
jgi:ADP-ribose pyrophosphatase